MKYINEHKNAIGMKTEIESKVIHMHLLGDYKSDQLTKLVSSRGKSDMK